MYIFKVVPILFVSKKQIRYHTMVFWQIYKTKTMFIQMILIKGLKDGL